MATEVDMFQEIVEPPRPKLLKKYMLFETIGQGTYGKVKKARHYMTGELYAIKILNKRLLDDEYTKRLRTEIQMLKSLKHPYIVRFHDSFETDLHTCIVMDYAPADLFDYFLSCCEKTKTPLDEHKYEVRRLLSQLALALEHLQSRNVVHPKGDLKLENVLLMDEPMPKKLLKTGKCRPKMCVKLIDFGMSVRIQPDELLTHPCGTDHYAAPEIFGGSGYDYAADMYSYGVIVYTLIVGKRPFNGDNIRLVRKKMASNDYDLPEDLEPEAAELIKGLLNADPKQRMTVQEVLANKWIDIKSLDVSHTTDSRGRIRVPESPLTKAVRSVTDFFEKRKISSLKAKVPNSKPKSEDAEKSSGNTSMTNSPPAPPPIIPTTTLPSPPPHAPHISSALHSPPLSKDLTPLKLQISRDSESDTTQTAPAIAALSLNESPLTEIGSPDECCERSTPENFSLLSNTERRDEALSTNRRKLKNFIGSPDDVTPSNSIGSPFVTSSPDREQHIASSKLLDESQPDVFIPSVHRPYFAVSSPSLNMSIKDVKAALLSALKRRRIRYYERNSFEFKCQCISKSDKYRFRLLILRTPVESVLVKLAEKGIVVGESVPGIKVSMKDVEQVASYVVVYRRQSSDIWWHVDTARTLFGLMKLNADAQIAPLEWSV